MKKRVPSNLINELGSKILQEYKLLYLLLILECDACGVVFWSVELRYKLEDLTGLDLYYPHSRLRMLSDYLWMDGDKIVLSDFISMQYGKELKENYNPHSKAWSKIEANGLQYCQISNQLKKKR